MDLLNLATSAFNATQMSAVEESLTSAVGSVMDTFIDVLPVIALIVGALWGIRFILHQFNKIY